MAQTRTMAFQISEDLFQRIKDYLAHENERQGRKVTQKEFVIGLIEDALERWEQETADADPGAPTDTLDPIDEPADSAPSWRLKKRKEEPRMWQNELEAMIAAGRSALQGLRPADAESGRLHLDPCEMRQPVLPPH